MKTIITLFLCVCAFNFTYSQEIYWTVYNMKIEPGEEATVLNAMDNFFKSETGMNMPSVSINGKMFSNSDEDYTHQIIFSSDKREDFGKMYSGALNESNDFRLLTSTLDKHSKNRGSYLGKSIGFSASADNRYHQLISLSISDPGTYVSEWNKLKSIIQSEWKNDVVFNLHGFISGAEDGVTHIAVISASSFDKILEFNDKLSTMPVFQNFINNVKDIRKVLNTNSTFTITSYNLPEMTARN